MAFGHPVPVSDLFSKGGRELLERMAIPEPWSTTLVTSLRMVDEVEREIGSCEAELRRLGADHPYVPRLMTVPGIGWVLAYTIAAEIGDIDRFSSPKKLTGYTGLCRGSSSRVSGIAVARSRNTAPSTSAGRSSRQPRQRLGIRSSGTRYQRTRRRLGRQRGPSVARVELARDLATAIWHMLTKEQPFVAAGPASQLVA